MIAKKDIEQAFNVTIATSAEMQQAQELWRNVFNGNAPWNNEKIKSTKIAKSISKKVAKLVTLNFEAEVTGSQTADYLNEHFQKVINVSGKNGFRATNEKANKNGTLIGRVVLRDFIENAKGLNEGKLEVDFLETDQFFPVALDERGALIDGIYLYNKVIGEKFYKLLERVTYSKSEKKQTINYSVWVSDDAKTLGRQANFSDVPDWANLQETNEYLNVEKPWYVMFVMPEIGTEDSHSEMGSALFANVIDDLQKADEIEELIDHEYKAGRLKQNISSDMTKKNAQGEWEVDKDVFNVFEGNGGATPNKQYINTYNPEFRYEALKARKNDKYRDIETGIGVAHGTISDINEVQKTATEVQHGREDTGSTVKEIQDTWEPILNDILDIMYDMAIRFGLVKKGTYQASYWWNDSIVVTDEEKQAMFDAELNRLKGLFSLGIVKAEEVRAFLVENSDYFSKLTPEMIEKAKEGLPEIEDEEKEPLR